MILQWIAQALTAFWSWICSHFPTFDVPSWFSQVASFTSSLNSHISGLGNWFPFGLLNTVLATLFVIAAASLVLKVVRIVASFFTAGGGSAA